jgi:hypothetical protein
VRRVGIGLLDALRSDRTGEDRERGCHLSPDIEFICKKYFRWVRRIDHTSGQIHPEGGVAAAPERIWNHVGGAGVSIGVED